LKVGDDRVKISCVAGEEELSVICTEVVVSDKEDQNYAIMHNKHKNV